MRSSARKRKPRTILLPLHDSAPPAASPDGSRSQPTEQRKRTRKRRGKHAAAIAILVVSLTLFLILIMLYSLDKVWVHLSLSSYPTHLSKKTITTTTTTPSQAKIAVVSLHEGFKYHGALGHFLRNNKREYSDIYGYSYLDTFPADEVDKLIPLKSWQLQENRAVYYKKPRFLLYLMEKYDNLEWLLWIDGDAIITQPYLSIEARIRKFEALHHQEKDDAMCLVWARDTRPNAGVMLIRNSPTARALLRTSLSTWEDTDTFRSFTDQASLTAAVQRNSTYGDCVLDLPLRNGHGQSALLQSRVRGSASWIWRSGHWILHLPNHNYLELLSSLKMVSKQLEKSPPPIFPPLERPSLYEPEGGGRI